jgi:uncharacterized DUF497 family protein
VRDDHFEWDDAKARENEAKHGVSFQRAKEVFTGPFAIEFEDDRRHYGEQRFNIVGMVEGRLVFVAYSLAGETIRLISARGATRYERRQYHEENS